MTTRITATHGPDVLTDTIIPIHTIDTVRNGYVQSCPALNIYLALRADLTTWECIYEAGGDYNIISADDFDWACDMGEMDDRNTTLWSKLHDGATELQMAAAAIPDRIRSGANDSLLALSEYLTERATDAFVEADKLLAATH